MSPTKSIEAEVARVATLSLPELRKLWPERFPRVPVPKHRSRDLMARCFTYRLQIEAYGDVPAPVKRRAAELARRFIADRNYTPSPSRQLKPGCTLIREWRGVRHEVAVLENGFSYSGQTFGSLSQLAQHITGVKWNGHVFFGLKKAA